MKVFRFILLITAIAIVACGKSDEDVNKVVAVNSVAISPNGPITLQPGEEVTLTASIEPENSTTRKAEWSSDNSSIATVTATGKVKAIAVGTAIITAKAEDKVATCRIDVTEEIIEAEDIVISPTGAQTLQPGEELQLTATISPENATNKSVIWSSDDRDIAMVDATGLVKAIDEGVAIITASIGKLTATCKLTVAREIIEVTSVEITPEGPITITEGEELQLTATVAPENATNKEVTWSSSDKTIATVSETGLVTAIAAGEATITASAGTMSASVEVTIENVYVAVTDIITNVEGDMLKLHWGETFQLELSVVPENATEQTIDYSFLRYNNDLEEFYFVKESEYLTVSEDGLITVFECNENLAVGEMIVMSAGDYTEELPILISPNEEEPMVPEGWIVNGNTATYKVSPTMDFDLEVTFENEVCKTVRFTTLTRESRATDIEAVFPESVLDAFTIMGRGTVATIDLLLVAGCKEYFENLTMAEMFAAFGDNTLAILANWTTSFSVTNLVTGNWEMPNINTLRERVNGGKDDGFSIMRVLVTYNEITGTVDSTTWTIGFETEEIATKFLQLVQRQNEVLYNRFADYIRKVQPREPILQIDVTDIFPESDQSAMEDVLSTTDVCRYLLSLAVGL